MKLTHNEPAMADARRELSPPDRMHDIFLTGSQNMQPFGMAETRDGLGGISVAPVVIGPVEGCPMVHDQVCAFMNIRQANREIQTKMRGVVAEIDKEEIDILQLQMLIHKE